MQTLHKFKADFFFQELEEIVKMKDFVRSARQWFQGMFTGQRTPVCMFSNGNSIAKKGYFNDTLRYQKCIIQEVNIEMCSMIGLLLSHLTLGAKLKLLRESNSLQCGSPSQWVLTHVERLYGQCLCMARELGL